MRAPARRRVRALNVLGRIKDQEIDAVTKELRNLQERVAEMRADRQALEERLEENARTETLEGSLFLARYARAVRQQMSGIDQRIAQVTPRLDALETRMRSLFAEAKTYESLQGRISLEELKERQRRESADLEEAFLLRWARDRSPGATP